jgi:hypothetical protein
MHCKAVVQPFASVQVVLLLDTTMKGMTGQFQFVDVPPLRGDKKRFPRREAVPGFKD